MVPRAQRRIESPQLLDDYVCRFAVIGHVMDCQNQYVFTLILEQSRSALNGGSLSN